MRTITILLAAARWTCALAVACLLAALGQRAALGDEAPPKGHYTLTGVKVVPIERTGNSFAPSQRLTRGIRFDIQPRFEVAKGTESQPFRILNGVVAAKSSWTFDKPIKFRGENVPAGTNVLKYQKFDGSFLNVSLPDPFPQAIHSAVMTQDFALAADTYTVKFEWTTADGTTFSDTVKVHIDVDLSAK